MRGLIRAMLRSTKRQVLFRSCCSLAFYRRHFMDKLSLRRFASRSKRGRNSGGIGSARGMSRATHSGSRRYFAAASSPIFFPIALPTSVELR